MLPPPLLLLLPPPLRNGRLAQHFRARRGPSSWQSERGPPCGSLQLVRMFACAPPNKIKWHPRSPRPALSASPPVRLPRLQQRQQHTRPVTSKQRQARPRAGLVVVLVLVSVLVVFHAPMEGPASQAELTSTSASARAHTLTLTLQLELSGPHRLV